MPPSSPRTSHAIGSPPPDLHLASWPLLDEGSSSWLLVLLAMAIAVATGYITNKLPLGLLTGLALFLSLWRLWIPTRYDLGPRGIVETAFGRQRRIPWSHVARYEVRRRGVLLLATHESTPLRALQARYVPWGNRRSDVLEMVRYYLDR